MKPKFLTLLLLLVANVVALAQPATNYYTSSTLDGKSGRALELALKEIINPHTQVSYDNAWTAYKTTDPGPTDSVPSSSKTDIVYDMYAWMKQFPKYYSDADTDKSAAHSQTGGINREHAVANSWWGGEDGNSIAYSDLHHLMPADGAANNAKSDYPLGEFATGMTLKFPTETKTNSSGSTYVVADTHTHIVGQPCYANATHVWKVSNSSNYGGASCIFEPADEYKGDFARMYFYVVCAYEGLLTWSTNYAFENDASNNNYTKIKDWELAILLKWHRQDPVSDKERNRNNAVYSLQKNRNPFIDYPDLVEYIWGDKSTATDFSIASAVSAYSDEYKNRGTEELQDATIAFTLQAKVGDTSFHGLTYTSDSDGTAKYESSNSSVATVDATTGAITIVGAGTTTITYTLTESDYYKSSSASYQIIVTE